MKQSISACAKLGILALVPINTILAAPLHLQQPRQTESAAGFAIGVLLVGLALLPLRRQAAANRQNSIQ